MDMVVGVVENCTLGVASYDLFALACGDSFPLLFSGGLHLTGNIFPVA